jgi:hypothetical protein
MRTQKPRPILKWSTLPKSPRPRNMLLFNKLAHFAGVAELADAQDLGSCGLKTVEVQILSPAPTSAGGLFRFAKRRFSGLNCAEKP